jgi:hypothetical protein
MIRKGYEEFIEGIHPSELRAVLPENLTGISYISLKGDRAGKPGVKCVDGYYKTKEEGTLIRQIREYDVKTFEEANELAKKDGLIRGIMIECILTEAQPCLLGTEKIITKEFLKYLKELK